MSYSKFTSLWSTHPATEVEAVIYNIWSVRDQGEERALVVARPEDRGRPEGDFVKWLGACEPPRGTLTLSSKTDPETDRVLPCGFNKLDLVQRELKKTYPDMHPLGKGTIARAVREKIHAPDLSRPHKWQYWAQRCADQVLKEMKRRGLNTKHPLNRKKFEAAMFELWRI